MKKLLVSLVVLTILAGLSLGFWTSTAKADFVEPPLTQQPYYTSSDTVLYQAVRDASVTTDMSAFEATFAGEGAAASAETLPLAEAGQIAPAFGVSLGTITLGAAAGYIGWKIGSSIYSKFLAPARPTGATLTAAFVAFGKTGGSGPATVYAAYACASPTTGCEIFLHSGTDTGGSPTWSSFQEARLPSTGMTHVHASPFIDLLTTGPATWANSSNLNMTIINALNGKVNSDYFAGECATNCSQPQRVITATENALQHSWQLKPTTASDYNALTTKVATTYTEPTHTPDDATAIRTRLGSGPKESRDLINWIIDHNYGNGGVQNFTPFILPQPQPTETYTEYTARLRAAGWLGTLTVEQADALEANAQPASDYANAPVHAPAGVLVSGNPIVWLYDPPNPGDRPDPTWPDNPPHINTPNTPITIKEKPGDTLFPPPTGGGGSGDCPCDPGSIDWSPLTSLDFGDQFPFGVPGFITGTIDNLGFDNNCWDFSFSKPGGGTVAVNFCNASWETDYRPWAWDLFIALMVFSTLAPLATRVIGLRKGDSDD